MGLHIVLYQPEIPANTGNIARTCLATNATLHLIHPLGFDISDKMVRRAGLDYWKNVRIREYDSIAELFQKYEEGQFFFIENFGKQYYTDVDYSEFNGELFFVFGRETSGLPKELVKNREDSFLKIHMSSMVRSLNLSNTVAIVIYEVLRKQGFPNMN